MNKYYYIIWVEGITYKDGEKVLSIHNRNFQYTTKMTKAMRIKPADVEKMKSIMLNWGISKWVVDNPNTFIKTYYAPKGTILNL